MRFNCSRMEVLTSGSFIARIKRTGLRTHALGPVDLMLVESPIGSPEQLAICYADEGANPDLERSLVFPLLKGSEFGDVKRHGNVLTVHATRLSIMLEAAADMIKDEDPNVSATSGKWARILARLVSTRERPSNSARAMKDDVAYFDGLGISVAPASRSTPSVPRPAAASMKNTSMHPVPKSSSTTSMSRPRQLVPTPIQVPAPNGVAASGTMPASTSFGSIRSLNMPKSRSLKRISLLISNGVDNGFGDDLKTILSKMDEPEQLEDPPLDEINSFDLPNLPFSEPTDSDFSSTPSPTSLYLQPDNSTSSISSCSNLKRVDTILAKEQQQYVEKYGARAATLSEYYNILPPNGENNVIPGTRNPPQMPAPVPETRDSGESAKKDNELDLKTTPRIVSSDEKRTSNESYQLSDGNSVETIRVVTTDKAKSYPNDIPRPTKQQRHAIRKSRSSSDKKLKTVSIAPEIHVINDDDDTKSTAGEQSDVRDETPVSEPTVSPSSASSPDSNHTSRGSERRLTKVMKRFLSKRKSKHMSFSKASSTSNTPDIRENEKSQKTSTEVDKSLAGTKNPLGTKSLLKESVSEDNRVDEELSPDSPNASTYAADDATQRTSHVYQHLLQSESASSTPELIPELAPTPALILDDEDDEENEDEDLEACESDDTLSDNKLKSESNSAEVIANASNNGGRTAAVPKMTNSSSISALSFRSLSYRSLSSRSLSSFGDADDTHNTILSESDINDTPEKNIKSVPRIQEENSDTESTTSAEDSPILLRRESKDQLKPIPIKLDLDDSATASTISLTDSPMQAAAKRIYESPNKSMSALPTTSKSSSYSSFTSSKRSLNSYSSASSASSYMTAANSPRKDSIGLFSAHMWASVWSSSKWTPLSQLEFPIEIVANESSTSARVLVNGGATANFNFTPQCDIRKVSNHDVEVKCLDATYMFRCRDQEITQKFYRTLWTIQMNGVQPVVAALLSNTISSATSGILGDDDSIALRRRTLMPPALSKSNPNLNLSYMGRLTSTIIEE